MQNNEKDELIFTNVDLEDVSDADLDYLNSITWTIDKKDENKETTTEKIFKMKPEEQIKALDDLTKEALVCLNCGNGTYEFNGDDYMVDNSARFKLTYYCDDCNECIEIKIKDGKVVHIEDSEIFNDMEDRAEYYRRLIKNDNIDEFYGLDQDRVVNLTKIAIGLDKTFNVIPDIGKFKIEKDNLIYILKSADGERIKINVGQLNDDNTELFENINKIKARVIKTDDYIDIIMTIKELDYEAQKQLDYMQTIVYLDYLDIIDEEDLIDFIVSIEYSLFD